LCAAGIGVNVAGASGARRAARHLRCVVSPEWRDGIVRIKQMILRIFLLAAQTFGAQFGRPGADLDVVMVGPPPAGSRALHL